MAESALINTRGASQKSAINSASRTYAWLSPKRVVTAFLPSRARAIIIRTNERFSGGVLPAVSTDRAADRQELLLLISRDAPPKARGDVRHLRVYAPQR